MLQRAQLSQQNDKAEDAIACVAELLALKPASSPAQRASALVAKANALDALGRLEEADAAANEAKVCLPDGDDAVRARYLSGRVEAHHHRSEFELGLKVIEEALTLFERIGDAFGASGMVNRRGIFLMLLARPHEAEAVLPRCTRAARPSTMYRGSAGPS